MKEKDIASGYEGLRLQAKALVETNQSRFLCFYLDETSKKVHLMADSESLKKVRESEALLEIEAILKSTFKASKQST